MLTLLPCTAITELSSKAEPLACVESGDRVRPADIKLSEALLGMRLKRMGGLKGGSALGVAPARSVWQ